MAAKAKRPEVVQLTTAELEQLLTDVRGLLPPATYHLIESLVRTLVWIMGLLEQKQSKRQGGYRIAKGAGLVNQEPG